MLVIFFLQNPYLGTWTRTREPLCTDFVYIGPVLGNLDPYSGTWTRTRELPVLVYVFKLPSTGDKKRKKKPLHFWFFFNKNF